MHAITVRGWWWRFSGHSSVIDNWQFKLAALDLIPSDCWLLFPSMFLFPTESRCSNSLFYNVRFHMQLNTAIQLVNICIYKRHANTVRMIIYEKEDKYTKHYPYNCTLVSKRCRDGALYIYLHFYKLSFLPCLHTFWHAIPTSLFSLYIYILHVSVYLLLNM